MALVSHGEERGPIERDRHYLGIDAVSWFLNKEDGWLKKHSASAIVSVSLFDGTERYSVALGTFELEGGARTAPVFQKQILPDRRYRGGPITIRVYLSSFARDSAISSFLRRAAAASFGLVSGMVEAATLHGPPKILSEAGEELVGGVRDLVRDAAGTSENIFAGGYIETTLRPENLRSDLCYLLFHRGAVVDPRGLSVADDRERVLEQGEPLEDGAWVLLRLRKSDKNERFRPWSDKARRLRADLTNLASNAEMEVIDPDVALQELQPSHAGQASTHFDEFLRIRNEICADGVLTEQDARAYVSELAEFLCGVRARLRRASGPGLGSAPGSPVASQSFVDEQLGYLGRLRASDAPRAETSAGAPHPLPVKTGAAPEDA